jgi:hypothetical protein
MILIAATLFLMGLLIWKKCQQAPETQIPSMSVPPMVMPIPMMGPTQKSTKSNSSIPISISISKGKTPKKRRDIGKIFEAKISEFS